MIIWILSITYKTIDELAMLLTLWLERPSGQLQLGTDGQPRISYLIIHYLEEIL